MVFTMSAAFGKDHFADNADYHDGQHQADNDCCYLVPEEIAHTGPQKVQIGARCLARRRRPINQLMLWLTYRPAQASSSGASSRPAGHDSGEEKA
jgi:hypothetical protein